MRLGAFFALLVWISATVGLAQAHTSFFDGYMKRIWQSQDGLPDQAVQAFAQTSDGYLWIGTRGGLVRFDGAKFVIYTRENSPGLLEDSINCLAVGPDGSLWIGTEGGGLIRYREGHFHPYSTEDGQSNSFVRAVYVDRQNTVWMGADQGLYRLHGDFLKRVDGQNDVPRIFVRAITQDQKGDLWVGGTILLRLRANTVQAYPLPGGPSLNLITSMYSRKDGTLWLGTRSGAYRLDPSGGFHPAAGVMSTVAALGETSDGLLWVGTVGHGLYLERGKDRSRIFSSGALPSNTVSAIFEDREGNVWLGTQAGMERLTKNPVRILPLPGVVDSEVQTVYQDKDGSLWAAGSNDLFHVENGIAKPYSIPGVGHVRVRTIMRDREGSLWIGTDGKGLLRIKGGKVLRYTNDQGFVNDFVRVIVQSRDGSLWVGTDGGVSHLTSHGIANFDTNNGLAYFSVTAIFEDREGDIWIGTSRGLTHLRKGRPVQDQPARELKKEKLWSIHQDRQGALWFGTSNGLYRFHSGSLVRFTTANGLASNVIYQILEDSSENLWLSSSTSVSRLSRKELDSSLKVNLSLYLSAYDMESAELNSGMQPAGCITAQGDIWFPSNRGLVRIMGSARAPKTAPPIVIDQVFADGQVLPADRAVRLRPGNGRLEISYAAMLLRSQEAVRYRYKLDDLEPWNDVNTRRTAYYTNLPPGKHRFRVQAFEVHNPEIVSEASIEVIQSPHFYRTPWFLAVCVLSIALVVSIIYRLRLQRMQVRFQAVLEERTRLAREMHDTLIQGCVGVSSLLEAATGLERGEEELKQQLLGIAREQVRGTIEEARQAVWNLRNSPGLSSGNLLLESICRQFRLDTGVPLQVQRFGVAFSINEADTHEIEMMVREALANAVRHGVPNRIDITIEFAEHDLTIKIRDDGCGFDPLVQHSAEGKHYGLLGMRERMQRLEGELQISSAPGTGTEITLRIPNKLRETERIVLDA